MLGQGDTTPTIPPPLPPGAPFVPTTTFQASIIPTAWRVSPPGAIFSPYGWGPMMRPYYRKDTNMQGLGFNYLGQYQDEQMMQQPGMPPPPPPAVPPPPPEREAERAIRGGWQRVRGWWGGLTPTEKWLAGGTTLLAILVLRR